MPTYDIRHNPTGVITERSMTIAALEIFLAENPDCEVVFLKMQVGDPVSLGVKQPPSDFLKHIIRPIEKFYFGKSRESRFKAPKEV